jgi:hypothetical protein
MLRDRMFEDSPSQVGLEIELNLVGGQMAPSMRNAQVLDTVIDPDWETELGQFNLEINVRPGCLCQLLEHRPGHRRCSGRASGQLPIPVRSAAMARDQDHLVPASNRH